MIIYYHYYNKSEGPHYPARQETLYIGISTTSLITRSGVDGGSQVGTYLITKITPDNVVSHTIMMKRLYVDLRHLVR